MAGQDLEVSYGEFQMVLGHWSFVNLSLFQIVKKGKRGEAYLFNEGGQLTDEAM